MSDVVIRAENLGKRYVLGEIDPHRTLREAIRGWVVEPVRRLFSRHGCAHPSAERGSKREEIWALRDVSFEVNQGEVLGIIGRNGAGKSTLLKLLTKITKPTTGRAEIHGRVASLLEIGTGFHVELTGRENVYLNGAILGMTKREIDHKFDKIVDFAGVEKFIDTPVKRYSSGMHVRLGFAVAAHLQPEILLVDEVLAVGDVEFQEKCIGKMQSVAREGRTVLVVSHNMSTVRSLCSKALLFSEGALADYGAVTSVIETYIGRRSIDAAVVDLSQQEYVSGGNRMRVGEVRLLDSPHGVFAVCWKQPISLAIRLVAKESLDEVSVGVGVKAMDDTWLFCTHQDRADQETRWSFDVGEYDFTVTLENPLKPGRYKLCIGAHQHHYVNNLFHTEAITFEVLGHSKDRATPMIYDSGLFNGIATWSPPRSLKVRKSHS